MKTLIRTAVTATALASVAAACASAPEGTPPSRTSLGDVRLVAYSGCDDLLAGLREKAVRNVGPYGFGNAMPMTARAEAKAEPAATSEHSTTNVHEAGVDEPDLVKTDGDRVVTVTDGTLRIIDAATRKVTESLDLTDGDGPGIPSDLLISDDRALVMLRGGAAHRSFGPVRDTRYVLVDLAGEPKVLSTIEPQGTYADARMVGSTVRLVTRSRPDITFPQVRSVLPDAERIKRNQEVIREAPAEAWLPQIKITDASGSVRKTSVACERISHPADYTGTSMLTVHTIDLARGVTAAGTDPIALAADGDIVYGTGGSLYVASNPQWWGMPFRPLPVAPTTRPGTPTGSPSGTASPDTPTSPSGDTTAPDAPTSPSGDTTPPAVSYTHLCLLYTADAAD
ncbi:beta-propeller domain-containing protein, partial [Nonomuraea mesophila]|uniref:beta-propeller domain-containing protein n=1 Tax=Nonomuraea mesophila TaxID=2530382 RepID=UPI001FE88274